MPDLATYLVENAEMIDRYIRQLLQRPDWQGNTITRLFYTQFDSYLRDYARSAGVSVKALYAPSH